MRTLRKILATLAGFGSLASGLFWHLSAKAALDAVQISGTTADAIKAIHNSQIISLNTGLWAAYAAVIAGIAVAGALFLDR